MSESPPSRRQFNITRIIISNGSTKRVDFVRGDDSVIGGTKQVTEKWTPIDDNCNQGQLLASAGNEDVELEMGTNDGHSDTGVPIVTLSPETIAHPPMEKSRKSSGRGPKRQRPGSRRLTSSIASILKSWLPIIQLSLLIQLPIPQTYCDDQQQQQQQSLQTNLMSPFEADATFSPPQDLLSQLSGRQLAEVATSESDNMNALSIEKQLSNQAGEQQQQLRNQQLQLNGESVEAQFSNQLATGAVEQLLSGESREQQQQFLEDLLESQTKALASSAASAAPNPDSTTATTTTSSGDQKQSSPVSGQQASAQPVSGSISEQLGTMTSLLQQIGAAQSGVLSEAIANSVANSIVKPALTSAANSINVLQRPTPYNGSNGNVNSRPPGVVGQGLNGNIEYDSNNNAINGFIEWPTFGFNSSSKPSFGSAMKPLVLAALKTVPIKLGSVGWKLLQLIAWKKIYKTHHPKTGEIIIEEELKGGKHGGSHYHMKGDSFGGGKLGKFGGLGGKGDLGGHAKITKSFGGGGGGHSKSSYDDGGSKMGYDGGMGAFGGAGGHPMMATFGSHGWPMAMDHGSPAMAASMVYQRHLLPPTRMGPPGASHSSAGVVGGGSHHNQQQHSATAAAAAAAATAAAIQSQWVQNQLAEEMSERDFAASSMIRGSSGEGNSSVAHGNNQPQSAAAALYRKRSTLANGSNWFAAPAHAYAAAAAAANAATIAAAAQQRQQQAVNPFGRLAAASNQFEMVSPSDGFREALAGIMYQNLFDNAAAMAVQNAVKLPSAASFTSDYLDQADSSSGSSLSSLGMGSSFSDGSSADAADDAWPSPMMGDSVLGRSDNFQIGPVRGQPTSESLLGLSEANNGLLQSPESFLSQAQQSHQPTGPSSLAQMTDFDDTPAGRLIGAALNETSKAVASQQLK